MHAALKADADLVGIDGTALFGALSDDVEKKVRRLHMDRLEQGTAE
jgi:hypothetical protein